MRNLTYALRWVIYLLRWLLYAVYGTLTFLGKPGSRLIVPVLAAAAAWYLRLPLEILTRQYVMETDWQQLTRPELYTVAAIGGVVVVSVYIVVSPRLWRIRRVTSGVGGLLRFVLRLALLAAIVGGGAWYAGYRPPPDFDVHAYIPNFDGAAGPSQFMQQVPPSVLPDAILIAALIASSFVYGMASRLLTLLLGAFPPLAKPLMPLRSLTARNRAIRSVVVRIAVPKLPKPLPPELPRIEAGADRHEEAAATRAAAASISQRSSPSPAAP